MHESSKRKTVTKHSNFDPLSDWMIISLRFTSCQTSVLKQRFLSNQYSAEHDHLQFSENGQLFIHLDEKHSSTKFQICGLTCVWDMNHQGCPFPLSQWCLLNFPPICTKFINFLLYFSSINVFLPNLRFLLPPILTMMHLCIILYTYWTPLWITEFWTKCVNPFG